MRSQEVVVRQLRKPWFIAAVAAELVSAAFAWRDLSRRDDAQVRGPRTLWRIALLANPGNSIGYWLIGRR